jgi:AAA domain (dynein-related subfamily)
MNNRTWRDGSKRETIAEYARNGRTKLDTFNALRPMVAEQIRPMIFSANVGGRRMPKPIGEQLIELKHEIGRVYALLGRAESSDFDSAEIEESEETETEETETDFQIEESETEETETEETDDGKPQAKGKLRIENELAYFEKRLGEIRSFCDNRARLSEPLDDLSTMRPEQAGGELIPRGMPADALLHSLALHWPDDARNDAGIKQFDTVKLSREIMSERELPLDGTYHEMFGYALLLAEARQPIMAVGPAGTGKSHLAKQLAEFLELSYQETPMTPGASRGDLLGRHTIGGFIPSAFTEIYGGGGVFNFEEIDASDPSMLIVLNNALAQNALYNSANGEEYEKHSDFVPFATANTFGLGANREYTGRERLDAATIDRWRMGRIIMRRDNAVASKILYRNAH